MKVVVALTGASGSMGRETLRQLFEIEAIEKVKVLMLPTNSEKTLFKKWKKLYGNRIEPVFGDISVFTDVLKLVDGTDYLFNLAAVIPPKSDHFPEKAYEANVLGPKNLVEALEKMKNPPKFVHISSVAVYGNRNYKHPWGRVGDPLLPSVFDVYAQQKMIAELFVTESKLEFWCILRQTAMLHNKMLTNNMKDGLMFHTCYNTPLEWVSAKDSGLLIKNILLADLENKTQKLWKNIFNIGGLEKNRTTGYGTFDDGFKIIGGSSEAFLKPHWNALRNFHGMWFSDSDELNDMFDFVHQSKEEYWEEILANHKYYKIAKIIPPKVISFLAIERLLLDENAPRYWIRHHDDAKVFASFGDSENIKILSKKWSDFALLEKNQNVEVSDYQKLLNCPTKLYHGYDEEKPLSTLDVSDFEAVAEYRGGEFLKKDHKAGDIYSKAKWRCSENHEFEMSPFSVLKGGHWCPNCNQFNVWNYDKLAKKNKFLASIWYDSHARNENKLYYFANGKAKFEDFGD